MNEPLLLKRPPPSRNRVLTRPGGPVPIRRKRNVINNHAHLPVISPANQLRINSPEPPARSAHGAKPRPVRAHFPRPGAGDQSGLPAALPAGPGFRPARASGRPGLPAGPGFRPARARFPARPAHLPLVRAHLPPVRAHFPSVALTSLRLRGHKTCQGRHNDSAIDRKSAQSTGSGPERGVSGASPAARSADYSPAGERPAFENGHSAAAWDRNNSAGQEWSLRPFRVLSRAFFGP